MVLTLNLNIFMLWIRLIFIIMHDYDINTIQLLLIHLALREIRKTFSVQKDYNLLIEGAPIFYRQEVHYYYVNQVHLLKAFKT